MLAGEWRLRPAQFRAAELQRNGAQPYSNQPALFSPCSLLLSPNYLPDKPELAPCYAPVRRMIALFDQASENKRFSADYRCQDPAGTGGKREITGRNRRRRVKRSGE